MTRDIKFSEYDNILEGNPLKLYWGGNSYYPADKIDREVGDLLKETNALKISFVGVGSKSDQYDELFTDYYNYIYKLQSLIKKHNFLIVIEKTSALKNRIRTFKGILRKADLKKNEFIEHEYELDNVNTVIIGMVSLTDNNFQSIITQFSDSRNSFIIGTDRGSLLSQKFLDFVIFDVRLNEKNTRLDYVRLIGERCSKNDIVYRMGGDGGDNELNFEIYFNAIDKDNVKSKMVDSDFINSLKFGIRGS